MRGPRRATRGPGRRALATAALAFALSAGGAQALAAADDLPPPTPTPAPPAPASPPPAVAPPADVGSVVGERAVAVPSSAATAAPQAAASAAAASARASDVADPAAATTPQARAAATSGVRILDFAYRPASVRVAVGDTIGWTNEDAAPHTATADDGSFDTGALDRGRSGSHTFTRAGTFAYHCTIHPSMTASVTVSGDAAPVAPAEPPAPADSSGSGAAAAAPAGATAGRTLPTTGLDVRVVALLGGVLLLLGLPLRSSTKPR